MGWFRDLFATAEQSTQQPILSYSGHLSVSQGIDGRIETLREVAKSDVVIKAAMDRYDLICNTMLDGKHDKECNEVMSSFMEKHSHITSWPENGMRGDVGKEYDYPILKDFDPEHGKIPYDSLTDRQKIELYALTEVGVQTMGIIDDRNEYTAKDYGSFFGVSKPGTMTASHDTVMDIKPLCAEDPMLDGKSLTELFAEYGAIGKPYSDGVIGNKTGPKEYDMGAKYYGMAVTELQTSAPESEDSIKGDLEY